MAVAALDTKVRHERLLHDSQHADRRHAFERLDVLENLLGWLLFLACNQPLQLLDVLVARLRRRTTAAATSTGRLIANANTHLFMKKPSSTDAIRCHT